jgi:adenylate kinase
MGLYLIIMGIQGAGKGTQAAFIKEKYNILHVSTGELFRAMKTREDDLARRVQELMESGLLIPDGVTNEVLRDRLEQTDAAAGAVLDGYPRNIAQAQWLEDYLTQRGEKVTAALQLDLDPYTAFKRAFGRVFSAESGDQHNIYTANEGLAWQTVDHPEKAFPPRLEVRMKETGEVLQRRADDEAVAVIKRIDTYLEQTAPLIDFYREKGSLVTIPADQSIDAVSQAIAEAIDRVK